MSHPYDAVTKFLVESRSADWLTLFGCPTTATTDLIPADLSTVSLAADSVLRVNEQEPWLFHLELQSSRDRTLPTRIHTYNALLDERHELPVRSAVVLLRSEADAPFMSGVWERSLPDGLSYLSFRYDVVRVWQLPVESLLCGPLGLTPLAPISNVTEADVPNIVQELRTRFDREATPEFARQLWTATDILMGLRYSEDFIASIVEKMSNMRESVTYQAIERSGAIRERQNVIIEQGTDRFGEPTETMKSTVRGISDLDQLKRLSIRVLRAGSWDELLGGP